MSKRASFLPALFAAFLLASAPAALRAQEPAQHASPGDHGQDRAAAAPAVRGGTIHEAEASAPEAAPKEKEEAVKLFGMSVGPLAQWIIQLVNLALFAGVLWYFVKGPVRAAFANMKKDLEDRLAQAERDKAEGEAQIKELEAKMAGLQAELGEILAKAGVEAEAEKERVLAAARTEATAILAAAESAITRQQQLASQELRALVAELAVEAAAKRLEARVQGAAAQTVTDHAIAELGGAK
ncbi:MAG TPA: ATP synthase F0 subunit B [Holophagaceae bacterium]|jgi:F-type H+-transporting ATPase subunit b|nr:ATP synthase F0 subunit B [Holophagaceae bacterium]